MSALFVVILLIYVIIFGAIVFVVAKRVLRSPTPTVAAPTVSTDLSNASESTSYTGTDQTAASVPSATIPTPSSENTDLPASSTPHGWDSVVPAPTTGTTPTPSTDSTPASNPTTTPSATPPETETAAPKSFMSKLLDSLTSVRFVSAVAIDVTLRLLVEQLAKKIMIRLGMKVENRSLIRTARFLLRLLAEKGEEFMARLGLRWGAKFAEKLAARLAEKAAVKAGSATAGQASLAAATGPGFPFVEAAMLAFDVLSIGLDIGDAGGYGKMGTIAEYKEMKAEIDKEIKKAFEENGAAFPGIIGPLDAISTEEYASLIEAKIKTLLNYDNPDPLAKPMFDAMKSDLDTGVVTASDLEDDSVVQRYIDLVDMDAMFEKANSLLCADQGGKEIPREGGPTECSYGDKNSCESSYHWPLQDGETYAEWSAEQFGGSCVAASTAMRGICESNNLPYDSATGICKVDETYCKSKGADWAWNDKIKAYDCNVNMAQDIAELIIGTTITRGLKQIFDPAQYETCKNGETDDGYTCRSVGCGDGQEEYGGLCYPKCTAGFHAFGSNVCTPNCPNGWIDDGATCRRTNHCEDGRDHQGALCYQNCKEGFTGAGPVCWQRCPDNWTDTGAFCSRGGDVYGKGSRIADKAGCPDGMRDDGTSCWRDTYGRGAGYALWALGDCEGKNGQGNCEKWGLMWYPKCNEGYHAVGCCLCEPDGGPGIKKTLFDRQSCHEGEDNIAGICWTRCREGYVNDGLTCRKPLETIAKGSYLRDAGTSDIQIVSKAASYGRGVGTPAVHIRPKKRIIPYSTKIN